MSTATMTRDEAIERSKTEPVCVAGQWFAGGLLARDEADARTFFALCQPYKPTLLERTRIGDATPEGWIVIDKRLTDGEMAVDCLHVTRKTPAAWTAGERREQRKDRHAPIESIAHHADETPTHTMRPKRPVDELCRDIARYLSGDRSRSVDSHQRDVFGWLRILADRDGRLTANPWQAYPTGGNETIAPVGAITAHSVLVGVGSWAMSHRDLSREPDTPTDGGLLFAFDESQRTYAAVGGHGTRGSELVPRLLPERSIHICTDGLCPVCPFAAKTEARRIFRSCLWWIGRGTGTLTEAELRQINVATTVLQVIL